MNRENARLVAKRIRFADSRHYSQSSWYHAPNQWVLSGRVMRASHLLEHACGTTACVAGWAAALAHPDGLMGGAQNIIDAGDINLYPLSIPDVAGAFLDLEHTEYEWLFSPDRTRRQVLDALEDDEWDFEGEHDFD